MRNEPEHPGCSNVRARYFPPVRRVGAGRLCFPVGASLLAKPPNSMHAHRKKRTDRDAEFMRHWEAIASCDEAVRALGIAGLQQFLANDQRKYHSRVAAALAVLGRLENGSVVEQTLTPVIADA